MPYIKTLRWYGEYTFYFLLSTFYSHVYPQKRPDNMKESGVDAVIKLTHVTSIECEMLRQWDTHACKILSPVPGSESRIVKIFAWEIRSERLLSDAEWAFDLNPVTVAVVDTAVHFAPLDPVAGLKLVAMAERESGCQVSKNSFFPDQFRRCRLRVQITIVQWGLKVIANSPA